VRPALLATLLLTLAAALGAPLLAAKPKPPTATGTVTVTRIADGDTLTVRPGGTIRLVQIDTPESTTTTECYGAEAKAELARLLPVGKKVRLERDPALDNKDRYGRYLRYAHRNGKLIQSRLISGGFAAPYYYRSERGRHARTLDRNVAAARKANKGAWGSCANPAPSTDFTQAWDTGPVKPAEQPVSCDGHPYPCAPPYPPDVDCSDLPGPVWVGASDPHGLDGDGDGVGCE